MALCAQCKSESSPAPKIPESIFGSYKGSDDEGRVVSFAIAQRITGPNAFTINDFRGVVYPFVTLHGVLAGDSLDIENYNCEQCAFLPSPGGTPRYYDAAITAFGFCFPETDSIQMYVDYLQTGTGADEFHGWIRLAKDE